MPDVVSLLTSIWQILSQLAPWLFLGMILSGLLHVMLPEGFIRRRFAGGKGVLQGVLLGIPLPLCSCGVVPAGIGLKKDGASDGAAVGFLISTPQTGVDSILVAASFLGWPFALFKVLGAGVTGVVGGWMVELTSSREPSTSASGARSTNSDSKAGSSEAGSSEAGDQATLPIHPAVAAAVSATPGRAGTRRRDWREFVSHGMEILHSIWLWLMVGVVISVFIGQWLPQITGQWLLDYGGLPAGLIALAASIPLYVCSTASVPIAAALVAGGLPVGAALIFLMAGPATNVTTIAAVQRTFGFRVLAIYLAVIILGSVVFAIGFDALFPDTLTQVQAHHHEHVSWWEQACAGLLVILMLSFAWNDGRRLWRRRVEGRRGADEPKLQIGVEGMTCNGCVRKLEDALRETSGVQRAYVELKPGSATITGNVDPAKVREVIQSCGFQPGPASTPSALLDRSTHSHQDVSS